MDVAAVRTMFNELRKTLKAFDARLKLVREYPTTRVPSTLPEGLPDGDPASCFAEAVEASKAYWEEVDLEEVEYPVAYSMRRGTIVVYPEALTNPQEAWYALLIGFGYHVLNHKSQWKLKKLLKTRSDWVLYHIYAHAFAIAKMRLGTPLHGGVYEAAAIRALLNKEAIKRKMYLDAFVEPSEKVIVLLGKPPMELSYKLSDLLLEGDEFEKDLVAYALLAEAPRNISMPFA